MSKRDFISVAGLTPDSLAALLDSADAFKTGRASQQLAGKAIAMLFQKPSLRTRVSFDIAIHQLGGHPIYLGPDEVGVGRREPVEDVARVLSRYVQGIVARVFAHDVVVQLAQHAAVPVVNGLSDSEHPCQALADLMTIRERHGRLRDLVIAFVGDGNNCAASLGLGAALSGAHYRIASPPDYQLPTALLDAIDRIGRVTGASVEVTQNPSAAVAQADAVYTDVWTSMGQEAEADLRKLAFAHYQVTPELLAKAKPGALLLHPLPAHHGEEIARGMLDHPASVVFDQAENRLHAQKAVLADLFGEA
ncbi:MAG: ornithine carbamoyltransferase [Dehalococcoidia bacterium]|nr:ornithine carbamoyltransferase [Dehalococcoidia bacterium]